ncbi:2-amino-4-hydroxy-6-hydroxymethyldihydropteridinediphosphokinase [Granulicella rosea]|uniref:2-amino-4-hydroxy-6-hydroxymethyldihydropteridine pyrophosphokinase n=1 Tax=Granulicella rosea TaxID=474952 RepID=A0A239LM68_9BACT|nr:2-amino-4-hydroxy-6-hydroxymethyldihydropteridine diphosphokinase [Granulicella rosea]SNT31390.1 2-amino-4-hydroxy-6-hydroxymethyldihydropteridinediphosphokinase [Granulicella rosea]
MRSGIALGSNLPSAFGDRAANLREALRRLGALGEVVAVSSFYDTDPVGYLDQPQFLNAAALLDSDLQPLALLRALLEIEREMGRRRELVPAKGPRIIDLDLLFADDVVMETSELTLPHPAMAERAFVLAPLAEIAPEWVHPGTRHTVAAMVTALTIQG